MIAEDTNMNIKHYYSISWTFNCVNSTKICLQEGHERVSSRSQKFNYNQFKINEPLRDCFHYDSRAV
jgi:hypothetical protein